MIMLEIVIFLLVLRYINFLTPRLTRYFSEVKIQ